MGRYRSSYTPPITFVANVAASLLRANPRRCHVIIPVPPGTTLTLDTNEPGSAASKFSVSGAAYPLVIKDSEWGDITERAITATFSNAITISVLEVFDTERTVAP
jgi:hypothetical protein